MNGLVRGLPPFGQSSDAMRIALIGETLGDVREIMIEGPSGLVAQSRGNRPRYEAGRRRGLRVSNDDHQFGWTRRGRIDADSWLASEIPLGEDEELYAVQLMQGENILASAKCDEPRWTVPAAQVAGLDEVVLQVRQISRAVGHGIAARCVFNFNI